MVVSVTRLHLRRWWFLPPFALHTLRSIGHAQRSAGFVDGQIAIERHLVFWTLTVWTDEAAMRGFRNTGAHMTAMPRLLNWCDEASYVHWQQDSASAPTSKVAFERLRDTGKLSKVLHPSAAHAAGRTTANAEPTTARRFTPRRPV